MTPAGPILRDIHLPPASWWPLAPGWWVLIVLLLVGVGCISGYAWRRRAPRRQWHVARRELAELLAQRCTDTGAFAAGVSQLLRRVARVRDPASAALHGSAWHAAMRRLANERVATRPLEELDAAIYPRDATLDRQAVARAAHAWMRRVLLHGGRHA